jgi:hypothetical protein
VTDGMSHQVSQSGVDPIASCTAGPAEPTVTPR